MSYFPSGDYSYREMLFPYAYQIKATVTYDDGSVEDVFSPVIDSEHELEKEQVARIGVEELKHQARNKYGKKVTDVTNLELAKAWKDPRRF